MEIRGQRVEVEGARLEVGIAASLMSTSIAFSSYSSRLLHHLLFLHVYHNVPHMSNQRSQCDLHSHSKTVSTTSTVYFTLND